MRKYNYGLATPLFHIMKFCYASYGPRQAQRCIRACAKCSGSDSSHSCAKSHPGICYQLIYSIVSMIQLANSAGPDQTAQMRRLIWASAVRICPKTRFRGAALVMKLCLLAVTRTKILCHMREMLNTVHLSAPRSLISNPDIIYEE